MLNAFTDLIRRQFDYYRTDAVVVYSFSRMNNESLLKDLTALFQGKKEIIYREFDNFGEIPSKRLTNVKTHFLIFPSGYGRIQNIQEYLPLFRGQNLIVLWVGSNKELGADKFRQLQISEMEQIKEMSDFESLQLRILQKGNIHQELRDGGGNIYKDIGMDLLLYSSEDGFKMNNYKQRIARFAGPVSPDNSGEAVKNEDVQVSFENKRQKIDPDEKGKELRLSIPSESEAKEETELSEDLDADRKRKMSQR